MSTSPYHEKFPHPVEDVSPFESLAVESGIGIAHDLRLNRSVVILEESDLYPRVNEPGALKDMLLETHTENHLLLPDNFITFGQALNDASGALHANRGQLTARLLFSELAEGLKKVATEEGKIPKDISYKNVVFSREEPGAKLLPPIEFSDFGPDFTEQAKKTVVEALWHSLEAGAATYPQRKLISDSFAGFIKAFDW